MTKKKLKLKKNNYPKIKTWSFIKDKNYEPNSYKSIQHLEYKKKEEKDGLKKKSINEYSDIQYWRLKIIDFTSHLIKKEINGKCLEIGAGKGLASAYLSTFDKVKKVTSLDYSRVSVEELMPVIHSTMPKVRIDKIYRVLGTFDKIKEKNFDFIYSFGVLHNSPNLKLTLKSCFNSLKLGGYLISSDMCLPANSTRFEEKFFTNSINEKSKKQYGSKIRWKDSNDYFRSLYDYIFYAKEVGFRVYPYIFDHNGTKEIPNNISDCFLGPGLKIFYPFFSKGKYDRLVLICSKEKKNKIKKDIDINGNPVWRKNFFQNFFE